MRIHCMSKQHVIRSLELGLLYSAQSSICPAQSHTVLHLLAVKMIQTCLTRHLKTLDLEPSSSRYICW